MNSALKRDFPDVFYRLRSDEAMLDMLTRYSPYMSNVVIEYGVDQPPA